MFPGILGFIEGSQSSSVSQLKPGSTVVFTVKGKNSDGSWTLVLGGRELSVRSETALVPGERMRARVQLRDGKIFLRLLETEKLARHALSRLRLPLTEDHKNVLSAMIKTGLSLREELVNSLVRRYSALSRRNTLSARLVALLSDKDLALPTEEIEKLLRIVSGDFGRGDGGGRKGRRDGQGRGGAEDGRGKGKGEGNPTATELRKKVERFTERGNVLSLFNHIEGLHENWLVIPFYPEESSAAAVLRLCVGRDRSVLRYTFSIYAKETWHFEGKLAGKTPRLVVYCSDKRLRKKSAEIVDSLRKKLHNLVYEIDDTIRETAEFEAFVSETNSDLQGVDTRV